jgi:hypothetical protein
MHKACTVRPETPGIMCHGRPKGGLGVTRVSELCWGGVRREERGNLGPRSCPCEEGKGLQVEVPETHCPVLQASSRPKGPEVTVCPGGSTCLSLLFSSPGDDSCPCAFCITCPRPVSLHHLPSPTALGTQPPLDSVLLAPVFIA